MTEALLSELPVPFELLRELDAIPPESTGQVRTGKLRALYRRTAAEHTDFAEKVVELMAEQGQVSGFAYLIEVSGRPEYLERAKGVAATARDAYRPPLYRTITLAEVRGHGDWQNTLTRIGNPEVEAE